MSTSPDSSLVPPATSGAAQVRREWHTMLLFVIAMLIFGGAFWFALPQVSRITKQWLGRRHLAALREGIKEQNWQQAATAMRAARHWAPDDAVIIRASIDLISQVGGDPRASISLLKQLQHTGAATPDDLALMGRLHVKLGEVAKARDILRELPATNSRSKNALLLQADLWNADGRHAEAVKITREALSNDADNVESLLQLASLDLIKGNPSQRRDIRERLWQTARGAGTGVVPAIQLLVSTPDLTAPEAAELLRLAEATTGSPIHERLRLQALSAQMRVSPQLRTELIQAEFSRWEHRQPVELEPLLSWLDDEHEHERILRLVSPQIAARYPALLPHFISALRGTGRWQDLHKLLTTANFDPSISAQQRRLWLAETLSHLDQNTERAQQLISRVFEESGRGDELLITLQAGQLAEQLDLWEFAARCYEAVATKHPQSRLQLLPKIYQMAEYQHDGPGLLQASSRMLELKPDSVPYLLQQLYLELLFGTSLEVTELKLRPIAINGSVIRMDQIHLLHALSAYRHGQSAAMHAHVSNIARPENLPAGQRVVCAALLKLSGGDPGRSFRLVERVSPKLLLPEEQVFLRRAL